MNPSRRRSRLPFANRFGLLATLAILGAQLPIADTVLAVASGTFTAKLTGSHEAPAVSSPATGSARVILSGSTIYYQVTPVGLGPIVGAEIDLGPIGRSGAVAFPLAVTDGSISGQLTAVDLAPSAGVSFDAALDAIVSGGAYVNLRTQAYPAGELRGQIEPVVDPPSFTITAGAPPAGTPARDDFFPRTLTVSAGSLLHLVVFGQHTATLLPAGVDAAHDQGASPADTPAACGSDASPCYFDGTGAISGGPASGATPLEVAITVNAPVGDYVVHSRLQASMVGLLRVVPQGSADVSSADDVALAIAAQLGTLVTPPPATSVYSGLLGYDVSYPDCNRALPPSSDGFAIVGVNRSRMFRYNPCLASLWAWAAGAAVRSLYINTNAAAGPTMHLGATGPAGTCAARDHVCYGYNYGYAAARAAWRYAYHQLGPTNLPAIWWLDVEIENTWHTTEPAANAAVLQGALDFLGKRGRYGAPSMNYTVGIYSTRYQYDRIGGGFQPLVPVWYATVERAPTKSMTRCAMRDANPNSNENPTSNANPWSFTGGPIWIVQYLPGGTDANVGCP